MPFKSKAQMAKFYADPKLRKYAAEWEAATPNPGGLPARVKPKKRVTKRATKRRK